MDILISIAIIVGVSLIVCTGLHIVTYIVGTAKKKDITFLSATQIWKSCGKTSGTVSILISASLATVSCIGTFRLLSSIQQGLNISKSLSKTVIELQQTSNKLALQGRNAISSFLDCKKIAESMLRRVDDRTSRVKLAVFWPMFGADLGVAFHGGEQWLKRISNKDENEFYYYLFTRLRHNYPTDLVFLKFSKNPGDSSPMNDFIDALSEYLIRKPDDRKVRNFSQVRAEQLKKQVAVHIISQILPKAKNNDEVTVYVTESIPILLFITERRTHERTEKEALVFIGNTNMLRNQTKQGGFYTQNIEMIEILDGLFATLIYQSELLETYVGNMKK